MLDPDISSIDALRHLSRPETDTDAIDRRRFLQLVGAGAGAAVGSQMIPGRADAMERWFGDAVGPNDGILVVIGMFGGNDGLNTVVPFNDPLYYDQHRGLALNGSTTLPLNLDTGLHPALTEMYRFWTQGQLAIVQGVGYPAPVLSHFDSMAYWMSGRPHGDVNTGWLGRWLDQYLGGSRDLFAATEIGYTLPLTLIGNGHVGTAVPPASPRFGISDDPIELSRYDVLRQFRGSDNRGWNPVVAQAFVDNLELVQEVGPVIPAGALSPSVPVASLQTAARIINADLGFRVLTIGWPDFDSHAGQPDMHSSRMWELNASIEQFFATLDPSWLSRVTLMTFSEFGRTSWANDSNGTDHGTAAPQFVMGARVRGGFYGQRPSLANLGRWDRMAHTVDFRSYYATVLDGWLGGGSSEVLGGNFENLGLFTGAPGSGSTAVPSHIRVPSSVALGTIVPVDPFRLVDTRIGLGASARPIGPGETISVGVAGINGIPADTLTAVIANVTAAGATADHYLTVYPGLNPRPATSNINGGPGRPVPNLVMMQIGTDGRIEVYNSHGSVHCVVDVFGYATSDVTGSRVTPVTPFRLFDTRAGSGAPQGRLASGQSFAVNAVGSGQIPPDATAVIMNLTGVNSMSPGYLRLTPGDRSPAGTSNVNFFEGDTVPNLAICRLDADGSVIVDGESVGVDVLGDVFGYLSPRGALFRPLQPVRVLDTRSGVGAAAGRVGPGRRVDVPLGGRYLIPLGATAVVLNVVGVGAQAPSHISVWPSGEPRPDTSNLNVRPGPPIANLVVCKLGGGAVSIQSPVAECHVVADVMGYLGDT